MSANASKRIIAYIIDFIFISAILMIVSYFIPKNSNVEFLNNDINNLTEQVLNNEITFESYAREYSIYLSSIDKENVIYNVISVVIMLVYYVIIPVIFKATLGKYIMKLEIKNKDGKKLNLYNTFIRSVVTEGMLYSLITIFLVQIVSSKTYLLNLIILGFIEFILVIISLFMILYRRDKRGLHDILSRSIVVDKEVKE
ncbi:MAG: RDD family protein [Lactobacillales bacterium]|nr:RDD family protein [Lactobacillales bacterium]